MPVGHADVLWFTKHANKAYRLDEPGWNALDDPLTLLAYLHQYTNHVKTKVGRRKLRLFACACARRHWDLIAQNRWGRGAVLQKGVEDAERFADDEINKEAFEKSVGQARKEGQGWNLGLSAASYMAGHAVLTMPFKAAWENSRLGPAVGGDFTSEGFKTEQLAQCVLFRDIFGSPFRPLKLDKACRTRTTINLATTIYENRTWEDMPILGDALEDAGCDSAEILDHCRGGGPHVRGCDLLDRVLGKVPS